MEINILLLCLIGMHNFFGKRDREYHLNMVLREEHEEGIHDRVAFEKSRLH